MLTGLFIQNIAVIQQATIDFSKGLTVMTGETGAGKSIIIDAISAILGGRTSKDIIRTGSEKAVVTAMFSGLNKAVQKKLALLGIEANEDELQIYREIRAGGKTSCKINGMPVTAAMLKELGVELIGIHGQHDSYELLSPEVHEKYLDNFAGVNTILAKYKETYNKLKEIKLELDKLSVDENQKERKIDLLKYQIDEIELANISLGESAEITNRRDLIRNSEKLSRYISQAKEALLGGDDTGGSVGLISVAAKSLEKGADFHEPLSAIAESLRDIEYSLQDTAQLVSSALSSVEFSPQELQELEDRADQLYRLSLKYGESEEEILKFLEQSRAELTAIELSSEKIEILSAEFQQVKEKSIALAKELSAKRKEAAVQFSNRVKNELKFLNMPGVEFGVLLERTTLNSSGCDKIQFLVSANPGEELKPMSKIASGGELSRIMLAIKTVLSTGDKVETMIFDEIDVGISGEAANKVGKKLKQVSENRQVICITHLAQIAAMADNHMEIKKSTQGDKTYTMVITLDKQGRVDELARIIGGNQITPLKQKMAEEMLNAGEQ